MKRGFTLIELLITIVILGVIVSLTMPNFQKFTDKAKAQQAATYLRVIRTGEKIYAANYGNYIPVSNASDIQKLLGAEVTEESYRFYVTADPEQNTFKATAARQGNSKQWFAIDQNGEWSGTDEFRPKK
ncbi:MAG: type II secretion system protein [Candidatus Omnitrophota bacterium]